jgi:hypothetical protein
MDGLEPCRVVLPLELSEGGGEAASHFLWYEGRLYPAIDKRDVDLTITIEKLTLDQPYCHFAVALEDFQVRGEDWRVDRWKAVGSRNGNTYPMSRHMYSTAPG